ncbi:orotidine-5'-phosphate decarboxylase [Desulfococcaceae bacterium HSG8]|nr:orotidine-5'-phosphate decarboxylase [Desulfococcaceae bacterium HSG8]
MKQAKDYIIFPLDVPSEKEAKEYVRLLSDHVGMFKVGLELFIRSGPDIIRFIRSSGAARVFLDLKLHDIPATVSRAMERITELGVTFATVHCGESREMLEAAVKGSLGKVGVLGVTVLTSVSGDDILAAGFREEFSSDVSELVMKRAAMARETGCAGIVCSALEARAVRENLGKDFVTVTPGIRPSGAERNDQQRVATPALAIKNGADYLVIGRPIRDAKDPRDAAVRISEEIESAFTD